MQQVEIFTDGACRGNPGPGGWGVLMRHGGVEKSLFGGELETTNNRMELTAVIEALNALKSKYLNAVSEAVDETSLEDLRVAAVGKKGEVSLKMRELGKMSPEERKIAGPALNALKDEINSALLAKKVALSDAALNSVRTFQSFSFPRFTCIFRIMIAI